MNDTRYKTDTLIDRSGKDYLRGFRFFISELSASTIYEYVKRVNMFMNSNGKLPGDLVLDDYLIYLGSIEDKTSSYRITTYAALKKFSMYLKASQTNLLNPMQYVSRPKFKESARTIEKREKGYLTKREIKEMKQNIMDGVGSKKAISFQKRTKERDMAILMIFLSTGIRCNALGNLDLDDINYDNHSIIVTDKGGKVNEYVVGDDAWKCLNIWIEKRRGVAKDNALFISDHTHLRLSNIGIYQLIKKYGSTITGKNITPHKLRATYGTQLYNATKDIFFVQKCMGHSSSAVTQLYIRGGNNKTKEASEIMNGLLAD